MFGDAGQDVGEVLEGIDAASLAGGDQRVEACDVASGIGVADEEVVLATEGESPFILPMLASQPWWSIDGIRSSA
jgi:hypothetical protein